MQFGKLDQEPDEFAEAQSPKSKQISQEQPLTGDIHQINEESDD